MGASAYVGRVGGLAVALGIGAAVFLGHGVASAETSGASGSGDTSSESSQSAAKSPTGASSTSDDKPGAATGSAPSKTADSTESPTTQSGHSGTMEPRTKKKRAASTESSETVRASTPTDASKDASSERSDATDTAHESTPAGATASTIATSTATTSAVSTTTAVTEETVVTPKPQPPVPADTVTIATSEVVSALVSPSAGDSPEAPVDSPLPLLALAAARKEVRTAPDVSKVVDPVTTSAVVDPASANVAPTPVRPYPTNVVAIPQVPLVTALGLQYIPIVGPLVVTPIVAFVNAIPIVGDILHPIFGYPLEAGLPPGSPQPFDVRVISFDGTQISVHFMPAAGLLAGQRAPTILEGPGLGMPGATSLNGTPLDGVIQDNLGQLGIATLRYAGYNVVTWDPRGEYFSGGLLELDSPDYEARDVSSIISWVSQRPEARLDGLNDPRVGMVGVSYGGGIQLVSAAIDHRIDAIVPTIAWNTLNDALYPNQDFKTGWGSLLTVALLATFARPNPAVYPAAIYGAVTTMLTQDQQDLLAARGPGGVLNLVGQIAAPTLLFQGTVDTLFPLAEADLNATALIAAKVPTKVVWFCGGHGVCLNNLLDPRDGALIVNETLTWLDRYVKGNTTTSTGPQFEWVDQRGQYYSSNVYPVPKGAPIVTTSSSNTTLPLLPFLGGSGPLLGVLPIGGTKALNAVNLTVPAVTKTTYVVGAPQLTLTYSGAGLGRFVYAQLVDDTTGLVLGNQVTPIPVTLNGQTQTITAPLNMVAATLQPGQTVTLQLVASAADFATFLSLGGLTVSSMTLSLPTADPSGVTTIV